MSGSATLTDPPEPDERANTPARVMIVDDSITARTMLARIVEGDERLEIVGLVSSANEALSQVEKTPVDVILLDLEMPGMGGLEALPKLIAQSGGANILVVSSLAVEGAEPTLKALALGAADTVAKPTSGVFNRAYRTRLADRIVALGAKRSRKETRRAPPPAKPTIPARPIKPEILAIGASTGGIHALDQLLGNLPPMIGIPILITQHLPNHFVEVFARQVARSSGRPTHIAENGLILRPDEIVIAPGEAHMRVLRKDDTVVVRLDTAPAESGCKPSVDPMFASAAKAFGKGALGIVLSGMGSDGSRAAPLIAEAGGQIWVQDAQTSAVWGMPRSVVNAGFASAILPPEQLAARIAACLEPTPCK